MKLAAIDIGSNAARLLISDVILSNNKRPQFQKINLVRVPLRLGFDVFEQKKISKDKEEMILNTIKAYKLLMDAYGVQYWKAAATSAMRDASNATEIIERVKKETGIGIEVITGDAEASLIYENHIAENLDKNHTYLYIDVGGGSTEITFFAGGRLVLEWWNSTERKKNRCQRSSRAGSTPLRRTCTSRQGRLITISRKWNLRAVLASMSGSTWCTRCQRHRKGSLWVATCHR